MDQSNAIHDLVTGALAELGMPSPSTIIQTMLMHDGYFVGWKFRYDGGHAIWVPGGSTIELYDDQGTLLKTVALEAGKGVAA